MSPSKIKASLFITCLVDQFFPEVGVSVTNILRKSGVDVDFSKEQTCCGQPAFNAGYRTEARELAKRFISVFEGKSYIVAPSGSCTAMVRIFYPELFKGNANLLDKSKKMGKRVYEFSEFLTDIVGVKDVGASYHGTVAYHPSCHLLREIGVKSAPQTLLSNVKGIELRELEGKDQCCGFGGSFSVKYPHISSAILRQKMDSIRDSGASVLVANDSGCLMHIGGGLRRNGIATQVLHIAELLSMKE